jgi:hypothetical protein
MTSPSIFLSHNREDKEFVRHLADDLRRANVTVWVDEAEIRIGDSIIEKIEEGLKGSEYLGVVLSPNSVASRWVKEELRAVLHHQIGGRNFTILPILYIRNVKYLFFLEIDCTQILLIMTSTNMFFANC